MIKKLIFDIDNTLIPWKDEYVLALKEAVEEFNINVDYKKIDDIIESLENKYEILTKEQLLKDINEECGLNLTINFIDLLFEKQSTLAPTINDLIETIKYLSSKYELVVLTNYFTEVQSRRLQTAGILKYFKNVYGGDIVKLKPNKEAFLKAIYPNNIDECIMIGDSLKHDLNLDIGLKTIIVDNKNILESNNEYTVIKNIIDLKDIL